MPGLGGRQAGGHAQARASGNGLTLSRDLRKSGHRHLFVVATPLAQAASKKRASMHSRTVFFVSDGTGITAETFGNAILNQFETPMRRIRLPFLDDVDKAHQAVRQINHAADLEGNRPLVFTTVVDVDVLNVFRTQCKGVLLDMFGTFIAPLEHEL
eukprot:gene47910-64284_t